MNYYLDESGNTGDLINKNRDLSFSSQPLFSLAAIGVKNKRETAEFVSYLIKKNNIQQNELKSSSLYKSNPQLILDVCNYINDKDLPFFIEVVDKRYFICTSIVNHLFLPPYHIDEVTSEDQDFKNLIADYLSRKMPKDCYVKFFEACEDASEHKLSLAMDSLRSFLLSKACSDEFSVLHKLIDESWDDYLCLKKQYGDKVISNFIPIPDLNKKGKKVHLLPHVSSLTGIIARTNCRISYDHVAHIPKRSYALYQAREALFSLFNDTRTI